LKEKLTVKTKQLMQQITLQITIPLSLPDGISEEEQVRIAMQLLPELVDARVAEIKIVKQ